MYEARGVATCGGGQLVARMGDLPDQVHGFGVGGSSRRERYSTKAIACGSHGFVVFTHLDCCFLRNLGRVSSGEHIERGAGMQDRCSDAGGVWILDNTVDSRVVQGLCEYASCIDIL